MPSRGNVAASESQLIERYFRELGARRDDIVLGIGDDAALLRVPGGCELALTTDALIEGVHFLPGAAPRALGHRALAVNLSDIAAMGAAPSWALLSLNLPLADEDWLREFAAGFGALARGHDVALVGGNLSRGALSITVQLAGLVPAGQALRRDGARAGDELYLSGSVGDAACGLKILRGDAAGAPADAAWLQQRFEYPTPRVALGQALRGIASACIDVSDGVYIDVTRLLAASGCGATLEIERLPLSPALRHTLGDEAWRSALCGGEDYELCFAAAPAQAGAVAAAAGRTGQALTRIGVLHSGTGLTLMAAGAVMQFSASGFDHFGN
ncbi:MAG TPA: thiamine-phosphate kinase [Steroidobacteraceae bacterium]|jgi:thiamine-monophosphate kinase|nr:thiamine-phosphate kinase [Steroidobacteraceae bacterium]